MTEQSVFDRAREVEKIEERFQILENKVLYQDRTIDDLNEVVTQQQDQIDRLSADLKRLRDQFESPPSHGIEGGEEPPPPHY